MSIDVMSQKILDLSSFSVFSGHRTWARSQKAAASQISVVIGTPFRTRDSLSLFMYIGAPALLIILC